MIFYTADEDEKCVFGEPRRPHPCRHLLAEDLGQGPFVGPSVFDKSSRRLIGGLIFKELLT